jgi:CDP-4-dehydro-6-deoxyglucose reductase, E1
LIRELEARKIATRLVFAGNLVRQPAYRNVAYRAVGQLEQSDFVMGQAFWIGLYPGLSAEALSYTIENLHEMVKRFCE